MERKKGNETVVRNNPDNSKRVIRTQIFTLSVEWQSDGQCIMTRKNDGFNIYELMGHISFIQLEICKQMAGEIKPDVITRTVIVDKDE